MTSKKKEQEKSAEKQPQVTQRRLVIQTDGTHVNIIENQLTVLELESVARRLLDQIARV